jgi:predicted dehydrogenase
MNRRKFLHRASAGGAAMLVPRVIPASALGLEDQPPPSERIVLGGIGIGARGSGVLGWMLPEKDIQFVAVCDAKKTQRESVKAKVDGHYGNRDCATYRDIREFLAARADIDAVLIATGDRWHALASVMAMQSGKDVYVEKPSCLTIAEGREVVAAAHRYERVYQTGTQRLSEANFTFANELLRLGRLGKVQTVRAHIAPWDAARMRTDYLPAEREPDPNEVDWDQWLGPCPWRPYNATYVQGGWRGHYDFHTSCIGEWGAHTFAQCQVAIDAVNTPAVEFKYVDNATGEGMVAGFPGGVKMILHREGWWHGACGVRYEGSEGWVSVADGYERPEVSSPALLEDFAKIVADYSARTDRPMSHVRHFFDCVKSRRPTVANADVMHHSMTTVHAANICMWLQRDLKFDPRQQSFVDDEAANRLLARTRREPWNA